MLTRGAASAVGPWLLAAFVALPAAAFANDAQGQPGKASPRWFSGLGAGVRGGYAFQERALGRDWFGGGLVGPEILGEILVLDIHSFMLSICYLKLFTYQSKGSEEIRTSVDYQRVDFAAAYDIRWKMLVAGVKVGGAWTIARTRTALGEPGWVVEGQEIEFTAPQNPEVSEHTGATFGFLAGLGVGLALGKAVFGMDDLVEIRAQSDYVRRGERDDFTIYGCLVFWPTRFFGDGTE